MTCLCQSSHSNHNHDPTLRSHFTGYTSGGTFNYCQKSDGVIDDEPFLAINSAKIGVVVDALYADGGCVEWGGVDSQ